MVGRSRKFIEDENVRIIYVLVILIGADKINEDYCLQPFMQTFIRRLSLRKAPRSGSE